MNVLRSAFALVLAIACCFAPQAASAQSFAIGVSINLAPPALPVYVQPPCPQEGYLWTPGYWGYGGGYYAWHPGYWGPHVGFYGGVNYGFGYGGVGFFGGRWAGGVFAYNTAVSNVNVAYVRNVYVDRTVVVNNVNVYNRVSFNGPGGVLARPTPEEQAYVGERHIDATPTQLTHQQTMAADRTQFASYNHGVPATTAMNSVNGRRFNQQGRIAGGVASGELTPGETRNLENRESNLNGTIRADRSANGGYLTPAEHQQIENRQNNLSNSIYDDKHNAAVDRYGDNEVGQRRYDQQQRISNGLRDGEMTPGEAARTENREQNITRSVNYDRAGDGGRLTPAERYNINQRQNSVSRQIYRDNHNAARAPFAARAPHPAAAPRAPQAPREPQGPHGRR